MSMLKLDHISMYVDDFDWYVRLFRDVFGMTVRRTKGEAPKRNLWFAEGLQLRECVQLPAADGVYDHLAFAVEDIPGTVALAIANGCSPMPKGHWFALPNGAQVELKPL